MSPDTAFTIFLGVIAIAWLVMAANAFLGISRLPRLEYFPPVSDDVCPFVSILFTARDEAEKLPAALATLLALDYPRYEVIAVNDRSSDATGAILADFARRDARLKVLHLRDLPAGWLGKPHGLQRAYEASRGDVLVFTDADVRFAPDVLRRALAAAHACAWDHITLIGRVEMDTFDEKFIITFSMLGFSTSQRIWRVPDPVSSAYCGVGSFQMLPRTVYQALGTHKRLAMEVLDDMKLGKLVKQHGFRSGVGLTRNGVAVRWHNRLSGVVRGVEKNFFAGAGYSVPKALGQIIALFAFYILPSALLFFTRGLDFIFAAIAAFSGMALLGWTARLYRASPLFGLLLPFGGIAFGYMLGRSMILTLRQGGVRWRDTFYPLHELRKGQV